MAAARRTRSARGRGGQEKYQKQRGKETSGEGEGRTDPAGGAELTLLPHPPVRCRAVYVRGRYRAEEQQTRESREGD